MDCVVAIVLVFLFFSNTAVALVVERYASSWERNQASAAEPISSSDKDQGSVLIPPCCLPLCYWGGRYHLQNRPDLTERFSQDFLDMAEDYATQERTTEASLTLERRHHEEDVNRTRDELAKIDQKLQKAKQEDNKLRARAHTLRQEKSQIESALEKERNKIVVLQRDLAALDRDVKTQEDAIAQQEEEKRKLSITEIPPDLFSSTIIETSTASGELTVRIGNCMANVSAESGIALEKVMQAVPFQAWVTAVSKDKRLEVSKIHVQSLDMFGPKVGFIKFAADSKVDGKNVPGTVFMRGGSVAILVILRQADRLFTLLVRQPRVPVCLGSMPEIPAGMLDGDGNFGGVAAKEMKEETGIELKESDLIDMTHLAYKNNYPGMIPLCECSDEFNRIFLYQKTVSEEYLASLNGKLTGVEREGEQIKLQIIELDKLWRTTPDAKALAALTLYKRLKGKGLIPDGSSVKKTPISKASTSPPVDDNPFA